MSTDIVTHRDVLAHTARRIAIAVTATIVMTGALVTLQFGVDPDATVKVSSVLGHSLITGLTIAACLAGALTYRSGLLMLELNMAKANLFKISRTDQLTGLLNRRGYFEAAAEMLAEANTAHASAVTLMCDIDQFKMINDRYGHEFGDKVLIEIADAMRAFGKEHGTLVARHGGEEFVALMVDVTTERAVQRANTLRQLCAAASVPSEAGAPASVTISIGLAASTAEPNLDAMMRAADEALYMAKSAGRDRVVQRMVAAA